MKRFILLFAVLAAVLPVPAKDNPEDYKVTAYKADGTKFEGYNGTRFSNYMRPKVTQVSISQDFGGTQVKYNGDEVKRVVFNVTLNDSLPHIYDAVKAQSKLPNLFSKNPKPYKEPVFLRLVYEGEHINGYAMPYTDHTMTPGRHVILHTWRYFYYPKDKGVAKAYWDDTDGVVPGMKKVMKFYFREFPEIVEMVEKGELTPEMFRKNPAMVLPLMDRTYDSSKVK